jgi:hypothetical protein
MQKETLAVGQQQQQDATRAPRPWKVLTAVYWQQQQQEQRTLQPQCCPL